METRAYFIFGDFTASALGGAAAGFVVWGLLPHTWWMVPAMGVGMVLGMAAALLVGALLSPLFGSFEILMPVSVSGMAAGMIVVMRGLATLSATQAVCTGAAAGIACLLLTYLLQARLHGEAT